MSKIISKLKKLNNFKDQFLNSSKKESFGEEIHILSTIPNIPFMNTVEIN